jgi:predicted transcriptional regulator
MLRMQVQLTDEQASQLRRLAAERRRSVAGLVREAVDHYLAEGDAQVRRERAVAAIGGFHSGLVDIAEDHDRYLAEDFGR